VFVADEHDDYTFAGEELAHAPFPQTEYHGNVREYKYIENGFDLNSYTTNA
jgi:hypothetical protein